MSIEGRLAINLDVMHGEVMDVTIHSSRPLQATDIFVGKSVDQLLETLPLLYSVCGTAQACASVQACEQALGQRPSKKLHLARELLVWMETAKEHLWQILLDWPTLLGRTPDSDGVAQMLALQRRFKVALFAGSDPFKLHDTAIATVFTEVDACIQELDALLTLRIFNCSLVDWLGLTELHELEQWIERSPTSTGSMMARISRPDWAGVGAVAEEPLPELADDYFQQQLMGNGAKAFIATPNLEGESRESTYFTRGLQSPLVSAVRSQWGNGLFARSAARLVELAKIPTHLQAGVRQLQGMDNNLTANSGAVGTGLAQVEAARGRLVHRVKVQEHRVESYQIVAPTEWNFHPEGVLAKGLKGLKAKTDEELEQQAIFLVNAVDPCVGFDLTLSSKSD